MDYKLKNTTGGNVCSFYCSFNVRCFGELASLKEIHWNIPQNTWQELLYKVHITTLEWVVFTSRYWAQHLGCFVFPPNRNMGLVKTQVHFILSSVSPLQMINSLLNYWNSLYWNNGATLQRRETMIYFHFEYGFSRSLIAVGLLHRVNIKIKKGRIHRLAKTRHLETNSTKE